jgi:hypothetical protein
LKLWPIRVSISAAATFAAARAFFFRAAAVSGVASVVELTSSVFGAVSMGLLESSVIAR